VLRWARAISGRKTLLVFDGCYHGTVDDVMVRWQDGRTVHRSGLVGQADDLSAHSRAIPFNDLQALESALAQGDVCALLCEPAMTNIGMVLPEAGFLQAARELTRRYGALQISQSALNMLLSLLLVVLFLQGAAGRIWAQVWATGIAAVLALTFLKRDGLLSFLVWKPAYLWEALKFGVPLIPHIGGVFLLASADRFVIKAEFGLAEAGIYMVAVQLSSAMGLVFDAINKAYVPWLFEHLKRDIFAEKCRIVRYTYVWFALILLGAALAFAFGPWLVTLVAGQAYAQAGEVIGWLALGQAFGGMYLMVTNYAFYSKRTGMLSLATITSGVINVILLVVLIRLLGLKGAAIAFSISMAIRFLLTWWVAQQCHPMPWFNLKVENRPC